MNTPAYFDYAAATPILPEVVSTMQPYFNEIFYNPSALYLSARQAKDDLRTARSVVARALGAKPNEVIFTAGGTEANNLAIYGVAKKYQDAHIVTTAIEHESVLRPVQEYEHTLVSVDEFGHVSYEAVLSAITDKTVLVSVMLANNEIGTVQDLKNLSKKVDIIKSQRLKVGNDRPLFLHTDACQAVNYLDINTARLGVDMMTVNAGKIYGPKQTGALFLKSGVVIEPQLLGGGQERNMRSGTQNVANIIGFAKAIEVVRKDVHQEVKRLEELQKLIVDSLVDGVEVRLNGAQIGRRLVNNVHLTIDRFDNERLLMELDERGVLVATGSACSASSESPSHVLSAIGLSETKSRSSIRITLGRYTTQSQCEQLIKSIKEVVAKR